jgi:hypothetical protein
MEHSTSKGWVRKKGRKKEIKDGRKEGRKLRMDGRKEGRKEIVVVFLPFASLRSCRRRR